MGYHTYAEVCKNVANLGEFNRLMDTSRFESDPNITDEEFAKIEETGIDKLPHRWKRVAEGVEIGNLYVDRYQKIIKYKSGKTKTLEVNLLNSSQYAMVGEHDWVVFSDTRKAVERFLKDFGIQETIAPKTAVMQTI